MSDEPIPPARDAEIPEAREGFPVHEQAFYMGAVWGHRYGRIHDGPLPGGDIYEEFLRCFPPESR